VALEGAGAGRRLRRAGGGARGAAPRGGRAAAAAAGASAGLGAGCGAGGGGGAGRRKKRAARDLGGGPSGRGRLDAQPTARCPRRRRRGPCWQDPLHWPCPTPRAAPFGGPHLRRDVRVAQHQDVVAAAHWVGVDRARLQVDLAKLRLQLHGRQRLDAGGPPALQDHGLALQLRAVDDIDVLRHHLGCGDAASR
jgi:hypothetical protein